MHLPLTASFDLHSSITRETAALAHNTERGHSCERLLIDFLSAQKKTRRPSRLSQHYVKGKGKVFPYSLPSVGPGADPGVQAGDVK